MKATTIDHVLSSMGAVKVTERSCMLYGGSCQGAMLSGGPEERKLSGWCSRMFRNRRWDALETVVRMKRCRQVLLPPSVSISVNFRVLYARREFGSTVCRMSLHH